MLRISIVLCCCLILMNCSRNRITDGNDSSTSNSSIYIQLLEKAAEFNRVGQLDSAKLYINGAVQFYKDQPISYADPSFKRTKDSLYSIAINVYDEIIRQEPTSRHYSDRGILKDDIGRAEEAIEDFTTAIDLDARNPNHFYNRGLAYSRINQHKLALKDYDECISLNRFFGSAYLNKGYTLMDLGAFHQAIGVFEQSLPYLPNQKEKGYTYNNMGYCYLQLNQTDTALEYINTSIEIVPINSYAYRNLALAYLKEGKIETACKHMEKGLELGFTSKYGNELLQLKSAHCGD